MFAKITAKRQVTFPATVLDAMKLKPGDTLEIIPDADGFIIRARRVDLTKLAPLQGKLKKGLGTFDLNTFRSEPYDQSLRD